MSAATYQRRPYNGGKRPGYTATPPPARKPATVTKGTEKLWRMLQVVSDPNTATPTTKTTKAMQVPGGVVINTCTRGPAGMCEALVFVPGATVAELLPTATSA